ncbi:MAG TPA: hypothetical protein DEA08_06425 [Planctomycetes bacterium]|nr:hypothetical protein [Planctomycetota bacterium]
MSFHDDFVLQLRADLAQALQLPAAAVYAGRQPQKVTRTGLEVWVRPLEVEPHGRGGGDQVKVRPYEVHVRLKERREQSQTGAEQLDRVRAALDLLGGRYDGARPFAPALPDLLALQVEEGSVDHDAGEDDVLEGTLVLRALER